MVGKIGVKVIKIVKSLDFKKLINYDGKCVSQVLPYMPSEVEIEYSCEMFNYLITKSKKIKSPILLFLLLLTHEKNISDALARVNKEIERADSLYQIVCCKDNEKSRYFKLTKEERLSLSKTAIYSLDWLS